MRKGAGSIRFWGQGFTHAIELLLAVAQSSQAGRIEEDGHTRLTSLTPAPIRGLQVISYAYPPGGPSLGEALRGDTASITSRQRPVPMPFPALPVKQDRAIQLTRQLGVYPPGLYPAADCGASHALALLFATHGYNNPVKYNDPTGHQSSTGCNNNSIECSPVLSGKQYLDLVLQYKNDGSRQAAINIAIEIYKIDVKFATGGVIYREGLSDYSQFIRSTNTIYISERTFTETYDNQTEIHTETFLAATIAHEGIHARQGIEGHDYSNDERDYINQNGAALNELEAYDYELSLIGRYQFSSSEIEYFKSERFNYYMRLATNSIRVRADWGDYSLDGLTSCQLQPIEGCPVYR
jgi:hypothetical protein